MTKPGPGKFEGNKSEEVAESLYDMSSDPDEEYGTVQGFGWYGLIKRDSSLPVINWPENNIAAYIVKEDSQGFFTYTGYEKLGDALSDWLKIEQEYMSWQTNLVS